MQRETNNVTNLYSEQSSKKESNEPQAYGEIEPWPEPVDASCWADAVRDVRRHIFLTEDQAWTAVLWVGHSHIYHRWDITPRLIITAPMLGCGKSTLAGLLADMSDRVIEAGSCTLSAYVTYASRQNQTFFIDEAQIGFGKRGGNPEMCKVLNNGYMKGMDYHKAVGDNHTPTAFSVYSPTALVGTKLQTLLRDDTLSRSILIYMNKAKGNQLPERYKRRKHQEKFKVHGRKIKRWLRDNLDQIPYEPDFKNDEISSRLEDNWTPLLAIAETVSNELADRVVRIVNSDTGLHRDEKSLELVWCLYAFPLPIFCLSLGGTDSSFL